MDINWSLIAPLLILQIVLMVVALLDIRKIEQTNGPKLIWVLIIIFISTIGPIAYFIFGRKEYD
ncbi:MAG TPA: PLD nuclease N-terminal domain-containing protein [Candidatus Pseudogracilibacillus intestinigallinarum]|uniref:PLD nuclease N-terminal domain-containing protein n=1 Tax=Candidatus Pseudogracilibacillus intestinigallinarum TaxID=2838742 RepID=A0A9D1PJE7_9BACI|nr:PLD nuclease N-terminal domain-containing protein [Candidatus Pseudogracilibacillus intestinigallinarum]